VDVVCVDKDPDISRYTVRKRGKSIHQETSAIDKGTAVDINYAGRPVNSYNGRNKSITYN
jgi:hypothetical protein